MGEFRIDMAILKRLTAPKGFAVLNSALRLTTPCTE